MTDRNASSEDFRERVLKLAMIKHVSNTLLQSFPSTCWLGFQAREQRAIQIVYRPEADGAQGSFVAVEALSSLSGFGRKAQHDGALNVPQGNVQNSRQLRAVLNFGHRSPSEERLAVSA